jgi:SNF2 family DNA or RNA helicase
LSELHSIFDYVMPGYLGTLKDFAADFSKDIEIRWVA